MDITFVTTAPNDNEAYELFQLLVFHLEKKKLNQLNRSFDGTTLFNC
jgi:hypothetical protein